jgi:hypothetical protein
MTTQVSNQYQAGADTLGKAIALRLAEGSESLPHDITERLRAARVQAVSKRKVVSIQAAASAVSYSGGEAALQFGADESGWWNRIASFLPLLALIAGLIAIAALQDDVRTREVAEVDAELLTNELPPAAFTDPGFAQYLRSSQAH